MNHLTVVFLSYVVYASDKMVFGARDMTVSCYECNTERHEYYCADPFNSSIANMRVTTCLEACAKWVRRPKHGPVDVRRSCADVLDIKMHWVYVCMKESRPGDGEICFCDDDLCNSAVSKKLTSKHHHLVNLAISFITLLLIKLCSSHLTCNFSELILAVVIVAFPVFRIYTEINTFTLRGSQDHAGMRKNDLLNT